MLFAAGMGIGLMFYGVSEPMSHFRTLDRRESASRMAARVPTGRRWARLQAMRRPRSTSAWRRRSSTGPAPLGDLRHGGAGAGAFHLQQGPAADACARPSIRSSANASGAGPGHIIDILAVFATLFGLATSLGFGATQALPGSTCCSAPQGVSTTTEVILITAITAVALISVVRGLDGGVKVLSEINMAMAGLLLAVRAPRRTDRAPSLKRSSGTASWPTLPN
jgi:BCCT family betaine/carnitine transporter